MIFAMPQVTTLATRAADRAAMPVPVYVRAMRWRAARKATAYGSTSQREPVSCAEPSGTNAKWIAEVCG